MQDIHSTELQPNKEKIDLYSEYKENKLQALTKTAVTYKCNDVWSYIIYGNLLMGKLFLASLLMKSVKKNQSHTIVLT